MTVYVLVVVPISVRSSEAYYERHQGATDVWVSISLCQRFGFNRPTIQRYFVSPKRWSPPTHFERNLTERNGNESEFNALIASIPVAFGLIKTGKIIYPSGVYTCDFSDVPSLQLHIRSRPPDMGTGAPPCGCACELSDVPSV